MSLRDRFDLVLLGAIWGSSFLFMRIAAPELGAIPLITIRVGVAAAVLAAVALARGDLRAARGRWLELALFGAINSAVPFCLFAWASKTLPAGFASVLNATVPLFVALLGLAIWRERLPRIKAIGLVLGFGGVIALAWPKLDGRAGQGAVAAGLGAALLYGCAAHHAKRRFAGMPALAISTASLLMSTLLLLPFGIANWPAASPSSGALACGAVLGVVCTGLAYLLYFRLLGRIGASRATTVTFLVPLFGVAWGALFLHEPITLPMVAAGAVIVMGTTLVVRSRAPAAG